MKARFFPAVAFDKFPVDKREVAWNSRKGDTLEKLLESGPVALAFIRALYRYMGDNAMEESIGEIDLYARSVCVWGGPRGGPFGNRAAFR